ncbi:MAG: glutamine--tRNA ligase/YqeY domain fusion protein [Candidatus Eisenbacteria bacterium]|nr:glutamine--tRNA ligase/YqeY domain fusion protein [Candidatus Eisenbacteria bacterium]
MPENTAEKPLDFVRAIVEEDNRTGRYDGRVHTRFPPEPNGYLHIGHAKAINLNYSIAEEYGGLFNLRFDDTNPMAEEEEFVESIQADVRWLGFDWEDRLYFASDYFGQLYEYARELIRLGKAYVCDLTPEETAEYRGTIHEPGRPSPYRDRSVDENLDLLERMKNGEFDDGSRTLRARIDMTSPNMLLRDPVIYRILHVAHHRTGDEWAIYPMYDFAHPLSDSIEGITHSNCSIEFESHRPLYDWYLDQLGVHHPRQTEFARLNLTKTVLSKRRLRKLVEQGYVEGWDDPRMPTIAGLRRRGYTPEAIREFLDRVGVAKTPTTIEIELLEHCLRDDLNRQANRVMAVLDPVRVVIDNYPEGRTEEVEAVNNPEDSAAGTRMLPFSGTVLIERRDFMEDPPKKFFRLAPGREVRLKHAYLVTCTDVVRNGEGCIEEIHCTYDPESRGGDAPDGRRVRGTLHWVSEQHSLEAEVRLYDHLLVEPEDGTDVDVTELVNPESLVVRSCARVEPSLGDAVPGVPYQFLRLGYFTRDDQGGFVFNRSVALRDTWAKIVRARKKS